MQRVLILAGICAAADAFSLAPSPSLGRTRQRGAASINIKCMEAGPSPRLSRRGLMVLLPVPLLLTVPGIVGAAEKKSSFKATSPGVALDAIIVMKAVKALRESGTKLENGDFKGVKSYLTSPWSSSTAGFLRKNKVLESLAKSLLGAAGWGDLELDPAFANEASPDSLQVASSSLLLSSLELSGTQVYAPSRPSPQPLQLQRRDALLPPKNRAA